MSALPLDHWLRQAEQTLRAHGLSGRSAYAAICRRLARELRLPAHLWLDGPDIPSSVSLSPAPLTDGVDLFGLAYERFFPEVFKSEFGQFFTPAPLARLVLTLTELRPGDRVLDPTCGAGTFLTLAADAGAEVWGIEVDPELAALCRLNLALHGVPPNRVRRADVFAHPPEDTFDAILANPPFSLPITRPEVLARYPLANGRQKVQSDVLFLAAAHQMLRPGGRLGVVLPWSLIANPGFSSIRAWLDTHFARRAVVGLPEGVFRPFGGAAGRAAVVVLEKRPADDRPRVSLMVEHLGYDPRLKRVVPTQPDGLRQLTDAVIAGTAPMAPPEAACWSPATLQTDSGIAANRPTQSLSELAPVQRRALRVGSTTTLTEVDLADVDKHTGEVTACRARTADQIRGSKAELFRGDLVVARMRPALNNVALVELPATDLPERIFGSGEWVRMVPVAHPHFVLTAARSEFVRAQLQATDGQTRPRASVKAIAGAEVPVPSAPLVELLDTVVGRAHRLRHEARLQMEEAAAAYAAWGRGELSEADLEAILTRLRDRPIAHAQPPNHG